MKEKDRSHTRIIRNKEMIKESINGTSNRDLAQKYGISEVQVSVILNHSDESKEIHRLIDESFKAMAHKALKAIDRALEKDDEAIGVAAQAAFKVIERTVGKVPDKLEAKVQAGPLDNLSDDELIAKAEARLAEIKARRRVT